MNSIPQKMVFGGTCLAKIDNKTVFVEGALPNETVEITITKSKKDYDNATVLKVLQPSVHRVEPFCPYYDACGGCNLQIADYDYQIILKKEILEDLFFRNRIAIPDIITVSDSNREYRSRFQFSFGGLKAKNSTNIVKINDCPCAVKELRDFLQSDKASELLHHERLQVFAHSSIVGNTNLVLGIEGQSEVCLNVLNKKIYFNALGFFQSNIAMLEKTIPLVVKGLKGKNLLDMYSGVGTLSLYAAENFEKVCLVEHNKKALEYAHKNYTEENFSNYATFAMSGEKWAKKAKKGYFDTILIDPPRSGIEKPLLQWLCTEKIPTMRYLSCDPATLVRDLRSLLEAGYEIEKFYFLDFYPHTHHMECLVYLRNFLSSAQR